MVAFGIFVHLPITCALLASKRETVLSPSPLLHQNECRNLVGSKHSLLTKVRTCTHLGVSSGFFPEEEEPIQQAKPKPVLEPPATETGELCHSFIHSFIHPIEYFSLSHSMLIHSLPNYSFWKSIYAAEATITKSCSSRGDWKNRQKSNSQTHGFGIRYHNRCVCTELWKGVRCSIRWIADWKNE